MDSDLAKCVSEATPLNPSIARIICGYIHTRRPFENELLSATRDIRGETDEYWFYTNQCVLYKSVASRYYYSDFWQWRQVDGRRYLDSSFSIGQHAYSKEHGVTRWAVIRIF